MSKFVGVVDLMLGFQSVDKKLLAYCTYFGVDAKNMGQVGVVQIEFGRFLKHILFFCRCVDTFEYVAKR